MSFFALLEFLGINQEWRQDALCAEVGEGIFYPGKGDPSGPALSICARCSVVDPCREYALTFTPDRDRDGVWGGTTPGQRRQIRAERATVEQNATDGYAGQREEQGAGRGLNRDAAGMAA